jgi:hypothetical protein
MARPDRCTFTRYNLVLPNGIDVNLPGGIDVNAILNIALPFPD